MPRLDQAKSPSKAIVPLWTTAWVVLVLAAAVLLTARCFVFFEADPLELATKDGLPTLDTYYFWDLFYTAAGAGVLLSLLSFFTPHGRGLSHWDVRMCAVAGAGFVLAACAPCFLGNPATPGPSGFDAMWLCLLAAAMWSMVRGLRLHKELLAMPPPEEGSFRLGEHFNDLRSAAFRAILIPSVIVILIWPVWTIPVRYMQEILITDVASRGQLVTTRLFDTFSISLQVSFYLGIAISLPLILALLWWFISPGLYPNERKFGTFVISTGVFLFFSGVAFTFYLVLPITYDYLLHFDRDIAPTQFTELDDFVSNTFMMCFIMGLVFELPLVIAPAVRFGLITAEFFAKYRRIVIFIAVILGAIITPTGDPYTLVLVSAPIYLLIEGGMLLGRFWRWWALKQRAKEGTRNIIDAFNEGLGEKPDDEPPPDDAPPANDAPDEPPEPAAPVMTRAERKAAEKAAKEEEKRLAKQRAAEEAAKPRDPDAGLLGADVADSFAEGISSFAKLVSKDVAKPGGPASESPIDQPQTLTPRAPIGAPEAYTPPPGPPRPSAARPISAPSPQLPRELRRRIDHYIQERLDQLLADALKDRLEKDGGSGTKASTDAPAEPKDDQPGEPN